MPRKKITVSVSSTVGVGEQHRDPSDTPQNDPHGVADQHREGRFSGFTVSLTSTQIVNHRGYC